MSKSKLTVQDTKEMLIFVSKGMVSEQDQLTQADKAIGDGDHGIGMTRGFGAVQHKLEYQDFDTIGQLLKTVGTTLMTSIGGASGAVFGTFFRGGAKQLGDCVVFDTSTLSWMLLDGLDAVKQRGKAKPGDKTMVDALEPAAQESRELVAVPLDQALVQVAKVAENGMEHTKDIVATVGKAKTLGERSLGHPDPGAISTFLILDLMAKFVNN